MCDTTGVTSVSLHNPDLSPTSLQGDSSSPLIRHQHHHHHSQKSVNNKSSKHGNVGCNDMPAKQNQVGTVMLCGTPITFLVIDAKERLCLAQISSTLLKDFSYNEIHNRRVALGITCVQCTPVQLEILRRAGAMPVTSRRCGMITRREAERLCQSFLGDHAPPRLPEDFAFEVYHECGWGSRGSFVPSRYNSSRAKCIRCTYCQLFFSPNKFIFHSHRLPDSRYVQPDAANFNSWRRHLKLVGDPPEDETSISSNVLGTAQIVHAWEDVRALYNGGTRKRMLAAHCSPSSSSSHHHGQRRSQSPPLQSPRSKISKGHHHISSSLSPHTNNSSTTKPTPPTQPGHLPHSHSAHMTPIVSPLFSPQLPSQNQSPIASESSPSSHLFPPPVNNPLLSPGSRMDIWNPGVSSIMNNTRLGMNNNSGTAALSHLPFPAFPFPWLRRPLFPFPHPFSSAAACHLLADAGMSAPEKLAVVSSLTGAAAGRNAGNQSAFKPVSSSLASSTSSRSATEHLFSWLNNNGNGSGPEDLSTNPGLQNHQSQLAPIIISSGRTSPKNNLNKDKPHRESKSPVSSTNEELSTSPPRNNNNRRATTNSSNSKHQIQILSHADMNNSEDEENVDIESTEVEDECSSTSYNWVSSSAFNNNNNNNNNSKESGNNKKRKFTPPDSNGGSSDDDDTGELEKHDVDDSSTEESCSTSEKRKRLWNFDVDSIQKADVSICCEDS